MMDQQSACFERRGGSRTAATSKMERFVKAVNYYHKELYLGYCGSPRSASGTHPMTMARKGTKQKDFL